MFDYAPIAATTASLIEQFGASAMLVRESTMIDPITGLPDSVGSTSQLIIGIKGTASRQFGEQFPAVVGSQTFKTATELRIGDLLTLCVKTEPICYRTWRVGIVSETMPGAVSIIFEGQLIA